MKRRKFLGVLGAVSVGASLPNLGYPQADHGSPCSTRQNGIHLAGMSLQELRDSLHTELFGTVLPFWDRHGIDHEFGGVMCSLDYDGTLVNTEKLLWFQGRALWVYSYLYNHFGQDPRHLEVARRTKDFVLKYGKQEDGWWAEKLSREGRVLKRFAGDIDGPFFIAEGLQEYAVAAKDPQARELAIELFIKLCGYFNRPEYRYSGPDFPELKPDSPCMRPQGTWMMNLSVGTEILQHGEHPEVEKIVDRALDAIIHRHYNPEIGLNIEMLNYDFTRPAGLERKVRLGHGIEVFWMVMDEADRRGDQALWDTCAERIHHALDVAWDNVYGGMAQWVNVDQGGYQWPPEKPVGTNFDFRFIGEYNYMKTLWGMNEVMVATLRVFERTKAAWAADYYAKAYQILTDKFRLKKRGLPGYVLFTDRQFTFEPHAVRQDNYHPIRQLMLNILALDRMLDETQSASG